ncbi:2197_t:CDS:1 [Entrophospora sp. SA101]|nr:6832_t:CDS:1 [Entrophospora sp. SA101]CAJ0630658.1 15924_t:CDS:1 [Entrophospora sp. SA101]CAJ0748640.1 2197_t:CDS:1 [Entrophospora sp. SA101]CAJ0842638.1 2590_t:CDS:1 [Entrophospora sp. SA101]CAJ0852695.1 9660_t:CDS:1 [Entrophospora sp. SA101]
MYLENGGIDSIEKENAVKSSKLYNMITNSKIYQSPVEKSVRSRMNIPFHIDPPELEKKFLDGVVQLGMVQLKGHHSVGGIRTSIYNAMPLQGVEILVEYMIDFEKKNSK